MKFDRFQDLVQMMLTADDQGGIVERHGKLTEYDVRQMNSLVLAYVGDAYFHLFIRTRLLAFDQSNVRALHAFSAQIVSAVWQHRAYLAIEPMLTDDEKAIYRRARNTKSHAPRSSTVAEYHSSTGFEALLGSLYLRHKDARLHELAEASFQVIAKAMRKEIQEET